MSLLSLLSLSLREASGSSEAVRAGTEKAEGEGQEAPAL